MLLANIRSFCLSFRCLPFFTNQALIQQLEDIKEDLDKAKKSGQQAVDAITASNGDPSLVQEELAAVSQKYDTLLGQLKDKQAQLEQAIEQGMQIQDKLDEIQAWTADSDETVKDWEPISTDPVKAQKQLEQLQVCMESKLNITNLSVLGNISPVSCSLMFVSENEMFTSSSYGKSFYSLKLTIRLESVNAKIG